MSVNPGVLSIQLFGGFSALLDGNPIKFEMVKIKALLAILVMEAEKPIQRTRLAGLLWPDRTEKDALVNLRQSLMRLRKAIGDNDGSQPLLRIDRETIQLNTDARITVDAWYFSKALSLCEHHSHRHPDRCAHCDALRESAFELYRGDFLAGLSLADSGLFDEWATVWRESFLRRAEEAIEASLSYSFLQEDAARCRRLINQLFRIDAWNEVAHASQIRLLVLSGHRAAAINHYRTLCDQYFREFGVDPPDYIESIINNADMNSQDELAAPRPAVGLPSPMDPFVGRQHEIRQISGWLDGTSGRLATIVGPGGIGKSRLAVEIVRAKFQAFPEGARFFSLEHRQAEWYELVSGHVRNKDMILVLDGVRTSIEERENITKLLRLNPKLVIIATARVPLGVAGEALFRIAGLDAPPPGVKEGAMNFDAAQFFIACAKRTLPNKSFTSEDELAIGEICRTVGGMPLALSLAAAWITTLTCAEISKEISKNIDILTSAEISGDEQARLSGVFNQSLQLLTKSEKQVFPRLSVFQGGFSREAAEAVGGAGVDILASLVRKSFVQRMLEERYELHPLFRQYGAKILEDSGTVDDASRAHFTFYLEMAESAAESVTAADSLQAFHRLVVEQQNLKSSLEWAVRNEKSGAERLRKAAHLESHGFGIHLLQPTEQGDKPN